MSTETYTIKIPQFEGPFDLLLFFIERDELDIYNIPIHDITADFLNYIRHAERMNIDLSGEFVLVAATLMRIKAKMLLPRKELDELGNEIDPRQELVERLLEYRRYKEVLEELRRLEEQQSRRYERGSLSAELRALALKASADAELQNLTLFKILQAYGQVLERYRRAGEKIVHSVTPHPYTLEGCRDALLRTVAALPDGCDFEQAFAPCNERLHAIFVFLALLELLQQGSLRIEQAEAPERNAFRLYSVSAIRQEKTENHNELN